MAPLTAPEPTTTTEGATMSEHTDLLATLAQSRFFLRHTTRDLTDEQAGMHTTVSALCLGGLIKHVADAEEGWANFILEGPSAIGGGKNFTEWTEEDYAQREASFQMQPGDTLAGVLERYEQVARRTDELVPTLDLDASHPLPEAPWFEPGAHWSARRVLMNIVAETTQHSGHADIIREALDGAKSM